MARPLPTVEEYQASHIAGLQRSTAKIRDGVNAVSEAPGQLAAQKADAMLQAIMEAVQSGRWAAAVSAVSLQEWKNLMLEKGIPRMAAGAEAAKAKNRPKIQKLLTVLKTVTDNTRSMERGTFEQNMQRMISQATGMHDAKIRGETT